MHNLPTRHILNSIFFLLCITQIHAQSVITGKVTDAKTGEALAFVNIRINNSVQGSTTDIDGHFSIKTSQVIEKLTFTYVGYQELIWINPGNTTGKILIQLQANAVGLKEVVVLPTENPAHRIIKMAVANKNLNNPDKQKSYRCKTYNKFVISSIKNDSAKKEKPDSIPMTSADSSEKEMADFMESQHLFLTESVSERQYRRPENVKETVLATRISGLKTPMFSLLATQFQPFSFYDDYIGIMEIKYLNPVSKGSINKYLFILEDTTYTHEGDTVYIISFRPRKNKNFNGLEGLLYINTHGYAIQNIIAESYDKNDAISLRIQQQYTLVNNVQWFPAQLNTDISFTQINVNHFQIVGIGRSYISEVELNPTIRRIEFGNNTMVIKSDAGKKDEVFWNRYRKDSLSAKDQKTYHVIDSFGQAVNLDRKVKWGMALISGKFRTGFVDWDLKKLMDYNAYEGLRLGLGLETNERLSNFFTVDGYYAYGFKDKAQKYGGGLNLFLHNSTETVLSYHYQNDVTETGGVSFLDREHADPMEAIRRTSVNRMESIEKHEVLFSSAFLKNTTLNIAGNTYTKTLTIPYEYVSTDMAEVIENKQFHFTEAIAGIRYAYHEKYTRFLGKKITTSAKYPIFYVQYTQGLNGPLGGQYNYTKLDAQMDYSVRFRNMGKTAFKAMGGQAMGDIPLINLYNARASYGIPYIFAGNSFNTMRVNEFFSDKYVSASIIHSFGTLLYKSNPKIRKIFHPELSLTAAAIWGTMSNPQQHQDITFKTLDKGYYEAGIVINGIWNTLGAGVFYRLGDYSYKAIHDNFAFKLSLSTSVLGF